MSTTTAQPAIGFIGLGDQGLPMATAIAEAGYPLHVWARHPGSLDALGNVAHVRHDDSKELAASCDIVALCVSTDEDVMQIVTGGLLDGLCSGSVIVNHGTGTPRNAVRLTETCARAGVDVLDAPSAEDDPPPRRRSSLHSTTNHPTFPSNTSWLVESLKRGSILTPFEGILYLSRISPPGRTGLPVGNPFASAEENPTREAMFPKK